MRVPLRFAPCRILPSSTIKGLNRASRLNIGYAFAHRYTSTQPEPVKHGIEIINTADAVTPLGPYSQAVKANGWVFLSGQIPAEPSGRLIEGTVTEKAHKMCQNARTVLEASGSSPDKAVRVTVFFQSFDDFKEMNDVYVQYFPHKPARSACEVKKNPAGAIFAMDVIALE